MRKSPQFPAVRQDYFPLIGGMNLEASAFKIASGECMAAQNYEQTVNGGYRRIYGYERFNGKAKPSAASYWVVPATVTGTFAQYDTVTGLYSGASGIYLSTDVDDGIVLTAVTGAYAANEPLQVSGATQATSTDISVQLGASTEAKGCTDTNQAADYYRSLIAAVPGSGAMRGVVALNDIVYAFRDNAGGTACAVYKSSASGWASVALGRELAFTSGGTYVPAEGDTITGESGGAIAVLTRILLESGSYAAGTAAGKFIFASQTGTFQAETVKVGANLNIANIAGNSSAITLSAAGRYEFRVYNFGPGLRIYGVDGVNRGFEFDGTVFAPIKSGQTADTPNHVSCHKLHLFYSFGRSVQHSSPGFPYQWTAVTGAAEINAGIPVNAMMNQGGDSTGGALAIWTLSNTQVLYGSSSADWVLNVNAPDAGAVAYTVQNVGRAKFLDNRGITDLVATQEFGNFIAATSSRKIQKLMDAEKGLAVASSVVKSQNQYRVYFSDGNAIVVTYGPMSVTYNGAVNQTIGIMKLVFPDVVRCTWCCDDSSGNETIYFGSDDGHIYQAEKGTSFDGDAIEAAIRLAFNHSKSPNLIKQYQHATLEVSALGYSQVSIQPDFSFGDPTLPSHAVQTGTLYGAGGVYGEVTWDQYVWGAGENVTVELDIDGEGKNMALAFHSNTDEYQPHTLHGALLHYIPRRIDRG